MKSHRKEKNNFGRMLVVLMTISCINLSLYGCAIDAQRKVGFNSMGNYQVDDMAKKVNIDRFKFDMKIDNSEVPMAINETETKQKMQERLKKILIAKNLCPVLGDEDARYELSGQLTLSEIQEYNGWLVPSIIFGVGLFPAGMFIMPAFPYNDFEHESVADVTLRDIDSGDILIQKAYTNKTNESMSPYGQGNPKEPDSTINQMLMRTADTVMRDLADEISASANGKMDVTSFFMP